MALTCGQLLRERQRSVHGTCEWYPTRLSPTLVHHINHHRYLILHVHYFAQRLYNSAIIEPIHCTITTAHDSRRFSFIPCQSTFQRLVNRLFHTKVNYHTSLHPPSRSTAQTPRPLATITQHKNIRSHHFFSIHTRRCQDKALHLDLVGPCRPWESLSTKVSRLAFLVSPGASSVLLGSCLRLYYQSVTIIIIIINHFLGISYLATQKMGHSRDIKNRAGKIVLLLPRI